MTAPFAAGATRTAQPVSTAGNDLTTVVQVVPRDGTVSAVTFTPVSAVTGANTNTRVVSLVNKGSAGSGTTVIATLQFDSGVNASAAVPKTITLSATAANLNVTAGDVLVWTSVHVGTGIADPGGLVSVSTSAKYA